MAPAITDSGFGLQNRREERDALDRLIAGARQGTSGAVVLRGQPGVGKTALLDYVIGHATGCRIARATGVESEMELPFAGLHQLCAPFLAHLDALPVPQRDALGTAFGLRSAEPPDRFLVGLATLSLLSDAAEQQPLICLVDDAQWLDRATTQVLGFVSRRIAAEGLVIVLAVRDSVEEPELARLTEMTVGPLHDTDARALLAAALPGRVDESVRDRIVAEARGNPLALLELPRAWTPAAFAGGFGLPDGVSVHGRIEESFRRRLTPLPDQTKRLLLVAAAEPVGDPRLILAAATHLGIPADAAGPAAVAGLLETGAELRFRHPLVRSVVYRDAPDGDRRVVHAALADVTDAAANSDRRAWHRAQAASGPNEDVALELEHSAGRAQARGGIAAAAAFLQRAVTLTEDPTRRAERALAAAEASLEAGEFVEARALLASVEAADDLQLARIHLLRGRIAWAASFGSAATDLLDAARELEPLDVDLARQTYLDAWGAGLAAGHLAGATTLVDIARAALAAPSPAHEPYPTDLLLDGLAHLVTGGLPSAIEALRTAVGVFRGDDIVLRWGTVAATAAAAIWDIDGFTDVSTRQLRLARDAGALALLATALQGTGIVVTWSGDFGAAGSLIAEADAVIHATRIQISPYGGMLLAAYRGREAEATSLLKSAIENATASGEGLGIQYARWTSAILLNGLGRYEEALATARQASDDTPELFVADWALAELVEAAVRTGNAGLAAEAADRLVDATKPTGSDWGLGIAARSSALTTEGEAAEGLYVEAIARLGRTPLRPELARAHLVYGEWLRRQARRVDARAELRVAYELFETIGMEAFAKRARVELLATGERVRTRSVETRDQLTPQEEQIARLARGGLSNPEISAQLYLSPRTIEWHLRKVFSKLGISSRRELRSAMPQESRTVVNA